MRKKETEAIAQVPVAIAEEAFVTLTRMRELTGISMPTLIRLAKEGAFGDAQKVSMPGKLGKVWQVPWFWVIYYLKPENKIRRGARKKASKI